MYNSEEILSLVNNYLDNLSYERKPESLYEPIRYVLSIGGKRVRPTLMMLAYQLYKEQPEQILGAACALETYHNFTLLHDDLMDQAPMRRGMPTVHKRWDANTAILSGDQMLVMAFEQMSISSGDKLTEVTPLFTRTMMEIGEGQQYDMEFESRDDVSEDEYIEMIRLKTSVLLACALKIGAILGGAPKEDADRLYLFGEKLGLAFQLQDDYLDVYGDPKVFGKTIGGDILSNKKTYMLINAYARANDKQREELRKWIHGDINGRGDEKIAAVTRLYNEIGINNLALSKINSYFEECQDYLNAVSVAEERKAELRAYVAKMMKRDK